CKICGIRKSSSICQFVCNVSSLYQGAKKATDSPQPTVPWSSIASKSKKSLFSIVPKLVVNGAFNFIFIRRMTISLMFIFCSSSFVNLESFISSLRIVSIMNRCTTTDFQTFFFHKIIVALCFILQPHILLVTSVESNTWQQIANSSRVENLVPLLVGNCSGCLRYKLLFLLLLHSYLY